MVCRDVEGNKQFTSHRFWGWVVLGGGRGAGGMSNAWHLYGRKTAEDRELMRGQKVVTILI